MWDKCLTYFLEISSVKLNTKIGMYTSINSDTFHGKDEPNHLRLAPRNIYLSLFHENGLDHSDNGTLVAT